MFSEAFMQWFSADRWLNQEGILDASLLHWADLLCFEEEVFADNWLVYMAIKWRFLLSVSASLKHTHTRTGCGLVWPAGMIFTLVACSKGLSCSGWLASKSDSQCLWMLLHPPARKHWYCPAQNEKLTQFSRQLFLKVLHQIMLISDVVSTHKRCHLYS